MWLFLFCSQDLNIGPSPSVLEVVYDYFVVPPTEAGAERGAGAEGGEERARDVEAGCMQLCERACPEPLTHLFRTNRFRNLHVSTALVPVSLHCSRSCQTASRNYESIANGLPVYLPVYLN